MTLDRGKPWRAWRPFSTTLLTVLVTCGAAAQGAAANDHWQQGIAVEGRDVTRVLVPAGAQVEPYTNAGYRLQLSGEEARIEVSTEPLESSAPFNLPPPGNGGEIERLARGLTAGTTTSYAAISQILGWVARHIAYDLDRRQPQDGATVLARRSGYCTGISRLTVELLQAVGLRAREVAGYVTDEGSSVNAGGYHRWVEAYLPDRGWIFSDPLSTHHYVPATYVRLASDDLRPALGMDGLLVERHRTLIAADIYPAGGPNVTARRNSPRQIAGALSIALEGDTFGWATLENASFRWHRELRDGTVAFVGLDPGPYRLRLELPERPTLERQVEIRGRTRQALSLPASVWLSRANRAPR